MRILFLTDHFFFSDNKAGFHYLAEAYAKDSHEVFFCTCPNSLMSIIKDLKNKKWKRLKARFKLFKSVFKPFDYKGVKQGSYFSFLHTHPIFFSLNFLVKFLFLRGYSALFKKKCSYDIIFFESSDVLFLAKRMQKYFPAAKKVYRISDDVVALKFPKEVVYQEAGLLKQDYFDLVSSTSSIIATRLKKINPKLEIKTLYNGINKSLFIQNQNCKNPYTTKNNFIFVAINFLDSDFLEKASRLKPDYHFHIIGPLPQEIKRENIHYYGQKPFEKTIPYIIHADVGLQCIIKREGFEFFEKTLKVLQYSFCKLPIVAPDFLNLKVETFFTYKISDESSIKRALEEAIHFNRSLLTNSDVLSWDEIAAIILKEL